MKNICLLYTSGNSPYRLSCQPETGFLMQTSILPIYFAEKKVGVINDRRCFPVFDKETKPPAFSRCDILRISFRTYFKSLSAGHFQILFIFAVILYRNKNSTGIMKPYFRQAFVINGNKSRFFSGFEKDIILFLRDIPDNTLFLSVIQTSQTADSVCQLR